MSSKRSSPQIKPVKMIVNANGGLRIRKLPDVNSEKIGLIPDGSEIESYGEILHEMIIDGKSGKWMKVKYYDLVGYSFSGFLIPEEKLLNPIKNEKSIDNFKNLIPSLENLNYSPDKDKRRLKLNFDNLRVTFDSNIGNFRIISISPTGFEDANNNYNFIFRNEKLVFSDMNMQSIGVPVQLTKYKAIFESSFGCGASECDEYLQTNTYEFNFSILALTGSSNFESKRFCSNIDDEDKPCPICSDEYKNESYTESSKWYVKPDGTPGEMIYSNKYLGDN